MSAHLSRCVAVYSRHFVASRVNAPAVVVAVVFTLDHFVTTQRTMGWTKSFLDRCYFSACVSTVQAAATGAQCPVSAVFDGRVEKNLCAQRSHAVRQRLIHSTDSNELSVHFKTSAHDRPTARQTSFYLLHYEGPSASSPVLLLTSFPILFTKILSSLSLQCFDTVGWVPGRASSL